MWVKVIPDTKPSEFVDIETEFDSHTFEDGFKTEWKMVNQDGNDYFTNHKWLFDVNIKVEFRLEEDWHGSENRKMGINKRCPRTLRR